MITNVEWQSYGVLNIQSGDTLFIRTAKAPDSEQAERLRATLPPNVTVIFVAPNVDISKWTPPGVYATGEEQAAEMDSKAQVFNPVVGVAISDTEMELKL